GWGNARGAGREVVGFGWEAGRDEAGRQGAHTQPRGYRSPCHWPAGSPSITSRDGLPSWYGLDREDRMKKKLGLSLLAAVAMAALGVTTSVQAQQASMTFS